MASNSLTTQLKSQEQERQTAATAHTFLQKAGDGSLAPARLCEWLVQDKFYQFGYVNFIGRLISRLDLTSYAFPKKGGKENLQWRTLQTLLGALSAIKAEIDFYNETVDKYALQLEEAGPNEVTQKYVRLFEQVSGEGRPLTEGLIVLWATEYVYLEAWTNAKAHMKNQDGTKEQDSAVAALHKEFIPNWTSDDFAEAVKGLAGIADEWAEVEGDKTKKRSEELWTKVLDLEAQFWPHV